MRWKELERKTKSFTEKNHKIKISLVEKNYYIQYMRDLSDNDRSTKKRLNDEYYNSYTLRDFHLRVLSESLSINFYSEKKIWSELSYMILQRDFRAFKTQAKFYSETARNVLFQLFDLYDEKLKINHSEQSNKTKYTSYSSEISQEHSSAENSYEN